MATSTRHRTHAPASVGGTAIGVALLLGTGTGLAAQSSTSARVREPLPLEVAASLRAHNARSPVNLSPDGEWIAHTIETDETVPRGPNPRYSETGFSFAEGSARMEATLSSTRGEPPIRLGAADAASWAAVWSPTGDRVAFYSDEGGAAGLWVWTRATGVKRRIPEIIVRPAFGFEMPVWSPSGEHILVKVLPRGVTLAEANAHGATRAAGDAEPIASANAPAVVVRRSTAAQPTDEDARHAEPTASLDDPLRRRMATFDADLALVDVGTGRIQRIAERALVRTYRFSPDGRLVAYSVWAGVEPNSQQSLYDLRVLDLATRADSIVARRIRLGYGIEWSWAPDGRRLAYTATGSNGDGKFAMVSLQGGPPRTLMNEAPSFDPGDGEVQPIWSPDGRALYGVAGGALWRVDPESGAARVVARIGGWRIVRLVTATYGSPVAWSRDGGKALWVIARDSARSRSGVHAVDVNTGLTRERLAEPRQYGGIFSLAASSATGEIVFTARDQRSLDELWTLDTRTGRARQASRINAALANYELGEARLIHWRSADGRALSGALLLPPGYVAGTRLPLVVWVYAGTGGSGSVNRFGLWGSGAAFNMHVLATRGFAVLYPDAPVRTGRITEDLVAAVLPAVDAAIAQGYADPERLAIMGQSYGSLNTLALLTRTTRFKAAVITAAVLHPDLFADYLRNGPYYEQGQGNMGGTIWERRDEFFANSPLFDFPRITTPLLIGQGERDGDLAAAEAIFTALERLGKPVEYRLYKGEGHVITGRANVIDFWNRRLAFLREHLALGVDAAGRSTTR